MENKRPQTAKTILRKNSAREIMLPDFRLQYKATVINTTQYQPRNRHTDQWNKQPRNKPTPLRAINLQPRGQNIQWRKDDFFNEQCRENWTAAGKETITRSNTMIKITQTGLRPKHKTGNHKHTQKNKIRGPLFDINCSTFWGDLFPKAKEK